MHRLALAVAATALVAGTGALAQEVPAPAPSVQGDLTVELNKFEQGEGEGCRAFFLFRNRTGLDFEGFEMSLAVLDGRGVIDRLLSIDAAPLPAERTTLKLFEIPGMTCSDISQVLLHEIPVCKPQNADPIDCFPLLTLASKAPAALVK